MRINQNGVRFFLYCSLRAVRNVLEYLFIFYFVFFLLFFSPITLCSSFIFACSSFSVLGEVLRLF